jgi:hypothetical protein
LIKPDNLKFATLAYRLKGSAEGRLKPLPEIPNLLDIIKNKDIARLHESSWMEKTVEGGSFPSVRGPRRGVRQAGGVGRLGNPPQC